MQFVTPVFVFFSRVFTHVFFLVFSLAFLLPTFWYQNLAYGPKNLRTKKKPKKLRSTSAKQEDFFYITLCIG